MKVFAILLIFIVASLIIPVSQVYSKKATEPVIIFDKETYSPFDWVQIKIIYPPANINHAEFDSLDAKILTSSGISKTLGLGEIEPNAGIFTSVFSLGPYPAKWLDALAVQKNDVLIVEFKTKDNMTFTKKADINFNLGVVRFDKDAFSSRETMEAIVWDPDRNSNPNMINALPVMLWSTTTYGSGITVSLREMSANSSEFHGFITLTRTDASSGTRLRVSDGDTVTARYTDNTPIPTDQLSPKGFKTFAVREVFASALISDCFCPPFERAYMSELQIFNLTDKVAISITQGDTAIIRTNITINPYTDQQFAYFTQIKKSDDTVVSLSWIRGELKANETMKAESTWIPESSGTYIIESFVWSDIDNPEPLGPVQVTSVEVK